MFAKAPMDLYPQDNETLNEYSLKIWIPLITNDVFSLSRLQALTSDMVKSSLKLNKTGLSRPLVNKYKM